MSEVQPALLVRGLTHRSGSRTAVRVATMSGADNLRVAAACAGLGDRAARDESARVLDRVGLTERARDRAGAGAEGRSRVALQGLTTGALVRALVEAGAAVEAVVPEEPRGRVPRRDRRGIRVVLSGAGGGFDVRAVDRVG